MVIFVLGYKLHAGNKFHDNWADCTWGFLSLKEGKEHSRANASFSKTCFFLKPLDFSAVLC